MGRQCRGMPQLTPVLPERLVLCNSHRHPVQVLLACDSEAHLHRAFTQRVCLRLTA